MAENFYATYKNYNSNTTAHPGVKLKEFRESLTPNLDSKKTSLRIQLGEEDFQVYQAIVRSIAKKNKAKDTKDDTPRHQFITPEDYRDDRNALVAQLIKPGQRVCVGKQSTSESIKTLDSFVETFANNISIQGLKKDLSQIEKDNRYKSSLNMGAELATYFPISAKQGRKIVKSEVNLPELSLFSVVKEIENINSQINLKGHRRKLATLATITGISNLTYGFLPHLTKEIVESNGDHKIILGSLAIYGALQSTAWLAHSKVAYSLEQVLADISQKINKEASEMIALCDANDLQNQPSEKINNAIREGKESTSEIFRLIIHKKVPQISLLGGSTLSLLHLNPLLMIPSSLGIATSYLWLRYKASKNHINIKKSIDAKDASAAALQSLAEGVDDIKTHKNADEIIENYRKQMDESDKKNHLAIGLQKKNQFQAAVPIVSVGAISGAFADIFKSSPPEIAASTIAGAQTAYCFKSIFDALNEASVQIQHREKLSKLLTISKHLKSEEIPRNSDLDISVSYEISESGGKKEILKDLSLSIKEKRVTALTGESGSGKSTLLRLICGIIKPTDGHIKISGENIANFKTNKKIAMAQQKPVFAGENILDALLPGSTKAERQARIPEVHKYLNSTGLFESYGHKLSEKLSKDISGGEAKRLGLVRALLQHADILLLDEPTSELDGDEKRHQSSRLKVQRTIEQLKKEYPTISIICATHDPELVKICDEQIDLDLKNKK